MLAQFAYLTVLFIELLFFFLFSVYMFSLSYSFIKGAPFVPTNKHEIDLILKEARLKKGQIFLDLGCGDGRLVRAAAKKYQINGIGIDINILLIRWANFLTNLAKLKGIKFLQADIINYKFPKADVIFIYLFPKLIGKIENKLKPELDQGALIISHGFEIKSFKNYLQKKIDHKPFPTYFYKI